MSDILKDNEHLLFDDTFPELGTVVKVGNDDKHKYVIATAPLSGECFRHYFKDKTITFLIDTENSSIKDDTLLTYLVNIGVTTEVYFTKDISYDSFKRLLGAWFTQDAVYDSVVLRNFAACAILTHLGVERAAIPFAVTVDWSYIERFAEEDSIVIDKWIRFLDSTEVFLYAKEPRYNDTILPHERYPTIDDPTYVGLNICNMYLSPEFINTYESLPREKSQQYFFKAHYTRYMFDNRHILEYIERPFNPISVVAGLIIRGRLLHKDWSDVDPHNDKTTEIPVVADILQRGYGELKEFKYPPDVVPKPSNT